MTPIQRVGAYARDDLARHLRALDAEDRRLRFGVPLGDEAIDAYVARIDFDRDAVFALHDERLALVAAAHVGTGGDVAELGVSVLPVARGRGAGGALVARAAEHARNRATSRLYMHCLGENATMIRLARRAGMAVVVEAGDADAHVTLPPATPLSFTSEILADRIALYDYALKSHVEAWRRVGVALAGATP